MKWLILILFSFSLVACSDENLPDPVDANLTPSGLEEREEEEINLSDPVDKNLVPAQEEERSYDERNIYEEEEGLYE